MDSRGMRVCWVDAACVVTRVLFKQGMFEPFIKSFYVRSTDATHIKTLKVAPVSFSALCTYKLK